MYEKHIFVCENRRERTNPLGCCASKGSEELTSLLKARCKEFSLSKKVRINKAGCLGQCSRGPVMVVYPEGVWYENVKEEDIEEIFSQHIINNKIVERLKFK